MSLVFALAFAACVQTAGAPNSAATARGRPCVPAPFNWRVAASDQDRERIRKWRDVWTEALHQARTAGHGDKIAAEGALLDPDAALAGVSPPVGDYACRTLKIGAQPGNSLAFVEYPLFRCRISRDGQWLTFRKLNGSQRPIGRLFGDHERRMIFLGTLQLGDERRAFEYRADRERDLAGLLERIEGNRWRIVFPSPYFESLLDVIELAPAR